MSWIICTIAATLLQTFRNLEQKNLHKKLDVLTVSWSRFILPLPFAVATAIYTSSFAHRQFIIYCLITAIFQVSGNIALLQTIKSKNFSIGVAFYKTETIQTLIIGFLLFNETISFLGCMLIIMASVGVVMMSSLNFTGGLKNFTKSLNDKVVIYGVVTGLCFSISAFNLKFSAQELIGSGVNAFKASVIVLMWVICFQNILFVIIKSSQRRLKSDFKKLFMTENATAIVKTSILSFSGSICWFAAYALGKVVYVKAVGQIELIIAIIVSHFILRERLKSIEITGITLTSLAILLLIFFH